MYNQMTTAAWYDWQGFESLKSKSRKCKGQKTIWCHKLDVSEFSATTNKCWKQAKYTMANVTFFKVCMNLSLWLTLLSYGDIFQKRKNSECYIQLTGMRKAGDWYKNWAFRWLTVELTDVQSLTDFQRNMSWPRSQTYVIWEGLEINRGSTYSGFDKRFQIQRQTSFLVFKEEGGGRACSMCLSSFC